MRTLRPAHAASLSDSTSSITIGRMLWTRALPGTVAVIAALTLPELSLGAGDLGDRLPTAQPGPASLPAPSRPKASPPALGPLVAGRPAAGSRDLLAPVINPPVSAASEPAAQVGTLVAIVPEVPEQPSQGFAAEIEVATLSRASRVGSADVSAFVAKAAAAPGIPLEQVTLARRLESPPSEAVSPALAPESSQTPVPAAEAPVQRAFGGARGSFVALAPSLASAPDMALAPENAIITAPTVPAGIRDAAPGRRAAMADVSTAPAVPDAAAGRRLPQQSSVPVEARALAAAADMIPVGRGAAMVEPAQAAGPATTPSSASAPIVATQAVALPAPTPIPVAAVREVAPFAANGSTPESARSVALAVPAPKAPVAAANRIPAPARKPAFARSAAAAAPVPVPAESVPAEAARAAALAPLPRTKPQQSVSGLGKSDAFQLDIKSQLTTRVDGRATGKVDFQQTDAGLLVRLGSIVDLLGDRYDAPQIARIRASAASDLYLSLAQLQAQGIPISYDPVYDEFNVGLVDTRPKAARKVHMDQISAPERGLGSTGIDQLRR